MLISITSKYQVITHPTQARTLTCSYCTAASKRVCQCRGDRVLAPVLTYKTAPHLNRCMPWNALKDRPGRIVSDELGSPHRDAQRIVLNLELCLPCSCLAVQIKCLQSCLLAADIPERCTGYTGRFRATEPGHCRGPPMAHSALSL
jgi:hypothetical protein